MRSALGMLRWTPEQFWGSTPTELDCAMDGYLMARGIDPDAEDKMPVMDHSDLSRLVRKLGDRSASVRKPKPSSGRSMSRRKRRA